MEKYSHPISDINMMVHLLFQEHSNMLGEPTPTAKKIVSNTFHRAGEMVKQTKENPSAVMIYVKTDAYLSKHFSSKQEKFIKHASKELGDRFIPLESSFGFHHQPGTDDAIARLQGKLAKFDFAKSVRISATGEFRNDCVKRSAKRAVEIINRRANPPKVKIALKKDAKIFREAGAISIGLRQNSLKEFSKWRRKTAPKKPRFKKPKK